MNERLLVNLLSNIMKAENQQLNADLKLQLLDTHICIGRGLKVDCKATRHLLKVFGNNVEGMLEDRASQNPQAYLQIPMPFLQELE